MEANPETAGPSESFRGEQATGQERERGGAGPSARTEWLEGMGAPATRRPHAPEILVVCLRVATRGQLLTAAAPGDLAMDPAPGGPGRPGGTAPLFRSPSCSLTSWVASSHEPSLYGLEGWLVVPWARRRANPSWKRGLPSCLACRQSSPLPGLCQGQDGAVEGRRAQRVCHQGPRRGGGRRGGGPGHLQKCLP